MSTARIHQRGYRRYEGVRTGVSGAVRSTFRQALRSILGLRRQARHKLLPWGVAALSYLPALGFVAVVLFLPESFRGLSEQVLPSPRQYLGGITLLVYLATALAGPVALCGDRRSGALALYLSSPLSRDTYLAAKAAATVVFLMLVTVVPPLIYVVGTVLAGAGPDGPAAVATSVRQVVSAGAAVALLFGGLSVTAASITDRTGAAAGIVVLYLTVSGAIIGTVVFALNAPSWLLLLDVNHVASESVARIHGHEQYRTLGTPAVLGALAVWIAALFGLTRRRYRRLAVSR